MLKKDAILVDVTDDAIRAELEGLFGAEIARLRWNWGLCEQDALDIVQESLMKAWVAREAIMELSAIKPWFCKIVRNTAIDRNRKQKTDKTISLETAMEPAREWDEFGKVENDGEVERLLSMVPGDLDRRLLHLRFNEELPYSEIAIKIADIVELTEDAIKHRIFRACRELRERLKSR